MKSVIVDSNRAMVGTSAIMKSMSSVVNGKEMEDVRFDPMVVVSEPVPAEVNSDDGDGAINGGNSEQQMRDPRFSPDPSNRTNPTGSISKNYGRSLKKSIHRTFSSTPCENLAPMNYQNGILQTPPILYHSFPPYLAHQKQPPLLPLPISKSSVHQHYNNHINTLSQNRTFSLPPTNRKVNKTVKSKKSSPKKDQESSKSSKVILFETFNKIKTIQRKSSEVAMISSTNPLGPDPKDLPKDVSMILSISSTGALNPCCARNPIKNDANMNQLSLLDVTSEKAQPVVALSSYNVQNSVKDDANRNQLHTNNSVVFTTVSPPPSSLPLPTLSLRPKLSCNAEASAGVDAGATDNLRRLLRLR